MEKTKAEIMEELRAEYRGTIKRTAEEEAANSRGRFRRPATRSVGLAYLLWFFLGQFGVHRFYLGQTMTGAGMLGFCLVTAICLLTPFLVIVGLLMLAVLLIWWVVDAFLIPKMAAA